MPDLYFRARCLNASCSFDARYDCIDAAELVGFSHRFVRGHHVQIEQKDLVLASIVSRSASKPGTGGDRG